MNFDQNDDVCNEATSSKALLYFGITNGGRTSQEECTPTSRGAPLLARLGSRSTKTREEACETVDLLNIIQAALDIIQDSGDIRSDHSKKEELSCSFDDN